MDISRIDKNFLGDALPSDIDFELHSVTEPEFRIFGVIPTDTGLVRMPHEIGTRVNEGVTVLYRHTSGGRVRFKTDSPYFVVVATSHEKTNMVHMARVGSSGFDVYSDGNFVGAVTGEWTPDGDGFKYVSLFSFRHGGRGNGNITLNMPLYNSVDELYIGIARGTHIYPTDESYALEHPVVYYGSSITQGGCASRPGMSYQAIVSRRLNVDHVNLGFSGSGRGERIMAEYIASLEMSAFVLDYDHNAPNLEHLTETHKPFFDIIRSAHPTLPIIIMPRPYYRMAADDDRREVIRKTYEEAKAAGDRNVYFISERELTRDCADEGTVDMTHPTDLGFWSMANAVTPVLERALGLKK